MIFIGLQIYLLMNIFTTFPAPPSQATTAAPAARTTTTAWGPWCPNPPLA